MNNIPPIPLIDLAPLTAGGRSGAAEIAPALRQALEEIGFLINKVVVGEMQPKAALDEAAVKVKDIMTKNGFYQGKDPMNFAATAPGMWVGKGKPLPF